jgi:hypothetical protein
VVRSLPGWLPGPGWGAVAADDGAVGALDLAGAVGADGEGPAELVQQHVVVPPAIIFEVGEAGGAAVGPVGHVVRFTAGGGLAAAAGPLTMLIRHGYRNRMLPQSTHLTWATLRP